MELLHGSVLSAFRLTVSLPHGRASDQNVYPSCPQHWADIANVALEKVSGTLKAAVKHGESEPPEFQAPIATGSLACSVPVIQKVISELLIVTLRS